jgi:hypothetical protein
VVTKHLDNHTKHPKVLFYYDFVNGVIDEKKDMLLVAELDLFTIGIIILPKLKILVEWWPIILIKKLIPRN